MSKNQKFYLETVLFGFETRNQLLLETLCAK